MRNILRSMMLVSVTALLGVSLGPAAADAAPKYVGNKACKKCHVKQYNEWKKTKMASALDLLKPNARPEARKKAGLDPAKDYTKDEKCLGCHTVGYGKPGGYTHGNEDLAGIGCESCHGPGSEYVAFKKKWKDEHKDDGKAWTWADIQKLGATDAASEKVCASCHDASKSKTVKPFDFAKRKKEGTHKHFKMKADHKCPHEHKPS